MHDNPVPTPCKGEPVSNASTDFAVRPAEDRIMRTFRDAKTMAKALRQGLNERGIALTHSDCLELVARQFGFQDWNILAARISDGGTPQAALRLPEGWIAGGSKPEHYEMGVDSGMPGSPALIRCKYDADDPAYLSAEKGFGTLMQSVAAAGYLGKRLRLNAELRTEEVSGAGTIWMRIDRAPGQTARFDNMESRSDQSVLAGTTVWTPRQIVLDVPGDAESIHFGFYLRGTGRTWLRNVTLVEVGEDVAATGGGGAYLAGPTNLDFSRLSPGSR
jgi:hypothetical protein